MAGPDAGLPVGKRIKYFRQRCGMSRPVLAGLVVRSADWLKAVESGRLQAPRLPMLLRLARALELTDLAELAGDGAAVPVAVFAGEQHAALSAVRTALTGYRISVAGPTPSVEHVAARLDQAWRVRHASSDHRTQLGALLPGLIGDAQRAAHALRGAERREARRILAGVYQLADFYVAYQPAPELVWLVADRALSEAHEADDPYAIAGSAWAMVQALRDAGRWDEAVDLAVDAGHALDRDEHTPPDWHGMAAALQAEIAYVHARRGRHGQAWAVWEQADRTARRLGPGYRHTQTSFSIPVMAAHATTLGVELRRPGEALQAANGFDAEQIVSLPRRARHLIEVARAHHQRDERHAVYALLDKSERTARETIRYNSFAREMLLGLIARPPSGMRTDVRDLAGRIGLVA